MALIVSSSALPSPWSGELVEEKRSPPRRHSTASSSSNADTWDSTNTPSSQHSSTVLPPSLAGGKKPRKRRGNGPEFVLHVQDCEFGLHLRVVRTKCRALFSLLQKLRVRHVVAEPDVEPVPSSAVDELPWTATEDDDENADVSMNATATTRIVLRQCTAKSQAAKTPHSRCALLPRQPLADQATASAASPSPRFVRVCCLAHQKQDAPATRSTVVGRSTPPSTPPDATTTDYSPGKENYAQSTVTTGTPPLSRVALAPKMPFLLSQPSSSSPSSQASRVSTGSSPQRQYAPSTTSTPASTTTPTRGPFHVELLGVSAEAIAVFIDYLYSGKPAALTPATAPAITRLCKWLCFEERLLDAALVLRAQSMQSVAQWMDVLLACTTLRFQPRRDTLIDYLLLRLVELQPTQFAQAMDEMPLHRLAGIQDIDVVAKIVLLLMNKLRRVETWTKLTTAVELWLFGHFKRAFATTSGEMLKPPSLLELHREFANWDPHVRMHEHSVSGIDVYVAATTLFTVGEYAVQVRLEQQQRNIMLWRVTHAAATSVDEVDEPQPVVVHKNGVDGPQFVVRGRLHIGFHRGSGECVLQDNVELRYTHAAEVFRKWQPLVSSSAHPLNTSQSTEADEAKRTEERSSSEEETAPLHDEPEPATTTADQPQTQPPPDSEASHSHSLNSSGSSDFHPLETKFSGQLFVWGHRLCNVYHYLLLSTLFYQLPADAPMEMRVEATEHKMRELPVATLLVVLDSDRLRVPDGESVVAATLATLCLSHYGRTHYTVAEIRALLACVRWCYVDLEQIMLALEHALDFADQDLELYELVERQLFEHASHRAAERRAPWGVNKLETPYRAATTLIEFQIEAGDRQLSPSKL